MITFDITGKTDRELIEKYSVRSNSKTYVPSRLLDAICARQRKTMDLHPGGPGTLENPVIEDGKGYAYGSRNKLILWEDYKKNAGGQD